MYFVANMAFLNYFEGLIDTLEVPFLHNVTMQEHILPISLESDDFDKELLATPETLREVIENYRRKKLKFDKQHETLEPKDDLVIETSIFNHLASKIFIFVMAVILLIVALIVIMLLFKGEKMQALVTNLAMMKGVKALTEGTKFGANYKYSKTIKIMIFILNIKSYVPIKLCKTSGSIHLFKLTGSLQREDVSLHRNKVWDILDINWRNITVMVNGNVINLPVSVIIPFRDKFKVRQMIRSRPLLLHLMLKQGQTWYPLSNVEK